MFQPANAAPARSDMEPEVQRIRELRAIAFCALSIDATNLPMWNYFAELKHLSAPGMQGDVLEARIALCLAAQIRPALTVRMINNLRKLRKKEGRLQAFDAFEAFFKEALGEKRLTNHGYQSANFSDMDHALLWERVAAHISVLKERGYEVFLNSGTLLGVVRDQKLIDHDDDIDLAVILTADGPEAAAQEWRALTEEIRGLGLLDEAAFENPAIIKLMRIDDVQVDLFPTWISEDQVFLYPHTAGELTRADLLPLATCSVSGNPIPAAAEKMLALNYGAGWQTPDPYFKFPWVRANRRFAAFREALSA